MRRGSGLGARRGDYEAKRDTGIPGLPELDKTRDGSVRFSAFYDTRDSVAYPTRGSFLTSRYVQSEDWSGGEFDYRLVEAFRVIQLPGNHHLRAN